MTRRSAVSPAHPAFGESDKDRRLCLHALELIEEALKDIESAERLMQDRNTNSTADEGKGKKVRACQCGVGANARVEALRVLVPVQAQAGVRVWDAESCSGESVACKDICGQCGTSASVLANAVRDAAEVEMLWWKPKRE
jgi:hypothetical protein